MSDFVDEISGFVLLFFASVRNKCTVLVCFVCAGRQVEKEWPVMPEVSAAVDTKEDVDKEDDGEKREIGKLAVWSVSSNKPGNGVEMLRDNNLGTYWQ